MPLHGLMVVEEEILDTLHASEGASWVIDFHSWHRDLLLSVTGNIADLWLLMAAR